LGNIEQENMSMSSKIIGNKALVSMCWEESATSQRGRMGVALTNRNIHETSIGLWYFLLFMTLVMCDTPLATTSLRFL
jgi:hypothetical protein